MKHGTLLAILTTFALVTLSCNLAGGLIGEEATAPTQPPAAPAVEEQATSPPPPEALAPPEQAEPITRPADGMVMVHIPAGEFLMGDDTSPFAPEKPQHIVYLGEYWMDRTEVSNAQYRLCVEAGVCVAPPKSWDDPNFNGDDQPALVLWESAKTYCEWAGGHLPTEAEWEKAARGTDGRKWPWGNEFEPGRANLSGEEDGYMPTAPVGSFPTGASPYGLLDMAGNAAEWVADWYDPEYYAHSPARNPTGPAGGEQKVVRGTIANAGGGPEKCRGVARYPQDHTRGEFGFRCAATTPPSEAAAPPSSAKTTPIPPPEQPPSQEGPPPAGLAWEDIPVYPGASEIMKEVTASFPPGSTDYELVGSRSYETDDEIEKVADFYLAEMPKKGWGVCKCWGSER